MKTRSVRFAEQLKKELKLSGASREEIRGFYPILENLSNFSKIKRSDSFKKRFYERPSAIFWPRIIFAPAIAFALLIIVGAISVFASQNSLPGESLYSLKRLSEDTVSSLKPEFKSEMLVRRSWEVKKLIEKDKDDEIIRKAIEEYGKERKEAGHSAVKIEESKQNLRQAEEKAKKKARESLEEELKDDSSGTGGGGKGKSGKGN